MKFLVEINTEHPAFKDRGHTTSADALRDYLVGTGRRYDGAVTVTELTASGVPCRWCESSSYSPYHLCESCLAEAKEHYRSSGLTQPDREAVPSS